MTPDQTNDPAVIRNSWDDPDFATPAEPRIDLLRAVRDDRQRIWEEVAVLREKVARVEALADEWAALPDLAVMSLPCCALNVRAALADPASVVQHDDATDGPTRLPNACTKCGDCYHPAFGPDMDGNPWCQDCGCPTAVHFAREGA